MCAQAGSTVWAYITIYLMMTFLETNFIILTFYSQLNFYQKSPKYQ